MPLDLDVIRARNLTICCAERGCNAPAVSAVHGWDGYPANYYCDAHDEADVQDPDDLLCARADIAALLAEVDRLTAELAAAQAGPVVEWHPDGHGWEAAHVGSFVLKLQTGSKCAGWRLFFGDARVTDGPETGEPGKAACFAAYLRACGLSAP